MAGRKDFPGGFMFVSELRDACKCCVEQGKKLEAGKSFCEKWIVKSVISFGAGKKRQFEEMFG